MKIFATYAITLCLVTAIGSSMAASVTSSSKCYLRTEWVEHEGERIAMVHLQPVVCFSRKADMRRYSRLVDAVKKVYPIAKLAHEKMVDLERELSKLPNKKSQKEYTKEIYKQLLEEYTPVMRRMTQTQGRVLLRLIDRQTEYTAYEVVDEFRGAFVASFWQGIGRLFGQDLKSEYGHSQEDQIIEQIIIYYESGLL
ncbi:MAG: DUF4294 domain-containing protein [Rikenellaceae bacterium]